MMFSRPPISLSPLRWRLGGLLAGVLLVGAVGCGSHATVPKTAAALPAPLPHTPEGQLEGVMRRLSSALKDAQAASGSGIDSRRSCSHQLKKPADDKSPLRAEVTIYTKIAVASDVGPAKAGGKDPKGDASASDAVDPISKKEVFLLEYDGDVWKMVEQPKGEIERLLFEFALKDQK